MKKITLLILTFLFSFSGFSQVLNEGFEGGAFPPTAPGNWAVFQNAFGSNAWTTNTSFPYTGTKAAYVNSRQNIGLGNTSKDFLATPLVTVPANGQLRFWTRTTVAGNQGVKYQIRIASGALPANQTDETAYTTLVQEWTEDQLNVTYNIYEEKIVSLNAYAGQSIYIAFVDEYTQPGTGLSGDTWLLDDVKLVSQCLDPINLTAGGFTQTSANLSWGNPSGATSWQIEVMPAGPGLPTGTGPIVGSNPYTVTAETSAPNTPLQPATSYKYYVKALCTDVGSQWVGPFTFSTATPGSTCLAPIIVPSALPYVTNSDTTLYGNNIAGPQGAGCAGGTTNYMTGNDVVYSYTPTVTGPITITLTASATNSSIFVYDSCANIGVSCLAGVANATNAPRVITLTVTAGQTYYIVISKRLTPVSTPYNLTIVANTCTNLAATFSVVSNCSVGPQFFVTANVTNLGSATSILATDNQASAPQVITATGVVQFGPFPNGTNVIITLQNQQDANCFLASPNQTQTFCPATNDLCSGATPIACGGTATQTTVGATTTGAPTGTCGTTAGAGGLWYSFVGTGDIVTFSLCGSAYDTKIQVVTGACGAFTCVAGNDDSCGTQSQVIIASALGVNYYVYVYGYNTAQGVFTLNVTCVPPPPPPANDNCDTAILVPTNPTEVCAQSAAGTTVGATPSTPLAITPCLGTADDDVWFEFVASATTHIINLTNIVGGTTNLNHIVYSGSVCGTLTQLYCSDPNGSIASNLTIGNTYKIRVYTSGSVVNQTATFNVCITVPPTNDECIGAIPTPVNIGLQCVVFSSGSLAGATASADSSTCVGTEDDDVWFSFVATSTAHFLSLTNVVGTTTNLNHAVYTGVCGSLVQKYCSAAGSLTSNNATFVIGQTYYVRVWSNVSTFQAVNFNLCIGVIVPPITTNTTQYTKPELVQDILLDTTCASVSNVTSSTGSNFGSTNGIGYFEKGLSEFPFENGVVLTTGNALSAPGPNMTTLSDGNTAWTGDAQLEAIVLAGTGTPMVSRNATKLEFDFVPISNEIKFNFIFASEEYGTFQCSYSDSFAFLLTNTVTGVTTNLAIIPNTTTPISVVTIRNQLYNAGCISVNPEKFGTFYGAAGVNPIGAPINFNGMTIPMTALSAVTAGVTYHIKMVIADRGDNSYDSAVFLEGGSFDIGNVDLGDDLSGGNSICIGDSTTLISGLNPANYTISWLQDGVVIPGQTGTTLQVSVPGLYAISAQYGSSTCFATDSVVVDYFQDIAPGTPSNLIICDASGFGTFDLTVNSAVILSPFTVNHDVAYFLTELDAINNADPILTPTAFTNTTNPQTIFVRVTNSVTSCHQIVSFVLTVQDLTPQFTLSGITAICPEGSTTITVVPTANNFDPSLVTYIWSFNGNVITGQTSSSLVINGSAGYGSYTVTVNNSGCTAVQSFEITNSNTVWDFAITAPTTLCPDENGTLSVNVTNNTTGTPATYTYTLPDLSTVVTLNNSIPIDATGIYTVDVNILGCINSQTITVGESVSNWNVTFVNAPYEICANQSVLLSFTADNFDINHPNVTYTWTAPNGTQTQGATVSANQFGNYTLEVDIFGCKSLMVVAVDENTSPIDIDIQSGCDGNDYKLVASPISESFDALTSSYIWTGPNFDLVPSAPNTIILNASGSYTVKVTTIDGCESEKTIVVTSVICDIQKGISPNNDGKNESFDLTGFNVQKLGIFNRYGTEVYSYGVGYTNQWVGQSDNGNNLPDGTYYYVIVRGDGITNTGWIYINR